MDRARRIADVMGDHLPADPHVAVPLVTASLGCTDQSAADVMTPRSRSTAIERTANAADLVAVDDEELGLQIWLRKA